MIEAALAIFGVLVGAVVTWLTTKSQQKGELDRLRLQLRNEWQLQWQQRFMDTIAELMAAIDPEIYPRVEKKVVVPLVHKAQLCLNLRVPTHARCNAALNQIALAVNGWHGPQDTAELLGKLNELFESARDMMWLPGK
jgi:hypothetical protein